ncbi:MAG: bifunctional precorrin-2 dehydrogenase/sirohydrochlorin ferrochelatase [Sedimentisphaerales bacterium]|nr:bifunctional precorrin-2 dehydrogenase/sirohydrochlorin ferrochelatase [Sedimentisphaerales bacterium]
MEKPLYPIFIDLSNRQVVVIGGGNIATHKVQSLLATKAEIVVIAPQLTTELQQLAQQNRITTHQRPYQSGDLDSAHLVICATNQPDINQRVRADADAIRVFCNVVDDPQHCSYYTPSVAQQGPLTLAVSTTGICPSLAKRLRQQLQQQFGPQYAKLLLTLDQLRRQLKDQLPHDPQKRKTIIEAFLDQALPLAEKQTDPDFAPLLAQWSKP